MKKLLVFAIAILGFSSVSFGQNGNTVANANASATIILPISLVKGNDMRFGTLAPSGVAGTVLLSTAGARTATNVQLQVAGGVAFGAGDFTATGQPSATYAITLPTTITVNSASNNMTIGTLLAKSASGTESHTATGTLGASGGTEVFTVGGTLAVGATQAVGSYTGTYSVTVNYN